MTSSLDHVGLDVSDYASSKSFYERALAPPGINHPTYYGAFVLDPDGNNAEAVCHGQ